MTKEDKKCPVCGDNLGWLAERYWFYSVPDDIVHYQHSHNLGLFFPSGWGDWEGIRKAYGIRVTE